jgi:hypothetical protein
MGTNTVKQDDGAWEVDQDEVGNPIVRHRHQSVSIGATLVKDEDGNHRARCLSCGEEFEVPSRHQ